MKSTEIHRITTSADRYVGALDQADADRDITRFHCSLTTQEKHLLQAALYSDMGSPESFDRLAQMVRTIPHRRMVRDAIADMGCYAVYTNE